MARGNLHFGQNARIAAAERNVEKFRRAVLERLGYFIQATGIMCNADTIENDILLARLACVSDIEAGGDGRPLDNFCSVTLSVVSAYTCMLTGPAQLIAKDIVITARNDFRAEVESALAAERTASDTLVAFVLVKCSAFIQQFAKEVRTALSKQLLPGAGSLGYQQHAMLPTSYTKQNMYPPQGMFSAPGMFATADPYATASKCDMFQPPVLPSAQNMYAPPGMHGHAYSAQKFQPAQSMRTGLAPANHQVHPRRPAGSKSHIPCRDFANNRCRYGDACQYGHFLPHLAPPPPVGQQHKAQQPK